MESIQRTFPYDGRNGKLAPDEVTAYLGAIALVFLLACSDVPSHEPVGLTPGVGAVISPSADDWMAVGTRVPVGTPLEKLPEPYTPRKHGPALAPAVGFPNVVGGADRHRHRQSLLRAPRTQPTPGNGDVGFLFTQEGTFPWFGVYGAFEFNPTLTLPQPGPSGVIWLYSPILLPPGGGCIEAVQEYERGTITGPNTFRYFLLWNHCEGSAPGYPEVEVLQTTLWTDRYVRSYQGKPTWTATIVTPATGNTNGQCWYANIYDFLQGGWVQLMDSCGYPHYGHTFGWTAWESVNLMELGYCPTIPGIQAVDIRLGWAWPPPYFYGQWVPYTDFPTAYSFFGPTGLCWTNGTYSFESPVSGLPLNSWRGHTPNP